MNAIDYSKHFVVELSNLEYLKSHWVTLEMKTFHHEWSRVEKKTRTLS